MSTSIERGVSRALLPAARREDPVLHPPARVMERSEVYRPLPGPARSLLDRLYEELRE